MVNTAMAISPACLEQCPYLCGALEALVLGFAGSPDPAAIEKQVCLGKEDFSCAFDPGNLAACKAVLSAGSSFNVPQTGNELSRRCSAAAGGVGHDLYLGGGDVASAAWRWAVIKATPLLLAWAA